MGAACFFATNILLKEIFNEEVYGQYSIVITYLSIVYMFGLLGSEQIFLRYSHHVAKNTITTQRAQVRGICVTIAATSGMSALFFCAYFQDIPCNRLLLYAATLCITALLYLFNIFRLNGDFVFAQLLANLWKLILLLLAAVFFIWRAAGIRELLDLLMAGIVLSVLVAGIVLLKKVRFVYDDAVSGRELLVMGVHFFISISAFSLLMFGDRFLIEKKFGVATFGNYFYLTNFFLAPFSILQNYVGFRQLVFFKKHFTVAGYNAMNRKMLFLGVLLAAALFAMPYLIRSFVPLKFDFGNYGLEIILLLVLGIVRLYSASILSAFEAKTDMPSLRTANIVFIFLAAAILIFALYFFDSLALIIAAMTLVWLVRSLLLRHLLLRLVAKTDS